MRKEFVKTESRYLAKKLCPWAARVVKAEGGFWCFESVQNFETWKKQK